MRNLCQAGERNPGVGRECRVKNVECRRAEEESQLLFAGLLQGLRSKPPEGQQQAPEPPTGVGLWPGDYGERIISAEEKA
jgi:hypothetical protein